jgi:PAS domain S-box-containing protein
VTIAQTELERLCRYAAELEQSLRLSTEREAYYRRLVERSNEGIWAIGKDAETVFANPRMASMLGYKTEEMIGRSGLDFLFEEDREKALANFNTRKQGASSVYDFRLRRKDGTALWTNLSVSPLEDAGQFLGVVGMFTDISERKRAEQALEESQQRLELALQGAELGTWDCNLETGNVVFSERCAEMLGYTLDEIEPEMSSWEKLVHPADLQHALAMLQEHLEGRTPFYRDEHRMQHKNGSWVWVLDHGRVFERSAEGHAVRACGVHQDITDRILAQQALRESEERFRTVFDKGPLGVALVGADYRFLRVNGRMCQILGYERDELTRLSFPEVTHPEDLDRDLAQAARLFAREIDSYQVEKRYITKQGGTVWACLTASFIWTAEGKPSYGIAIVEEITKRKQAQAQLESALENLERTTAELRRSNKELERFASIATHDLQEPLRSIEGFANLLGRRYKGRLDEDADEMIAFISQGTKRMGDLIRDLLQYARATSDHKQTRVSADIEAVLQEALLNLKFQVEECGATITHGPLPTLTVIRSQFVQLLQNLIGNALKYRKADVPPVIHVAAEEDDNHRWLFTVRDNGIGFDPAQAQTIFQPFKRLHREAPTGSGIGLAVCQRIVDRHGGSIWAETQPEIGSTFFFTISEKQDH